MLLELGQKRDFGFKPNKRYTIRVIEEKPEVTMSWVWEKGVCPHCKEAIKELMTHKFFRLEILTDDSVEDENLSFSDILVLGFTEDKKIMLLDRKNTIKVLQTCGIEKLRELSQGL